MECDKNNCPQENRIATLEKNVDDSMKKIYNNDLLSAKITEQLKNIKESLDTLTLDVRELKGKPAKKYDNLISMVLQIIIATILAFLAVKLGLK